MPESYTDAPLLSERFDAALHYASEHHRRQLRKGSEVPYVAHLLAVAAIALEMGGSEDEAIAALLHDVVEDGGGPRAAEEIEARWGADVIRIVLANSDSDGSAPRAPWRPRKEAYIDAIATKRPDELRVSIADKLHNARSIVLDHRVFGEALWSRFHTGQSAPVRWYYSGLVEAFEARRDALGPAGEAALDELARTVADLEELAG